MFDQDTKEELARRNQGGSGSSQACESTAYIPMTISTPIHLEAGIKKLPITVAICREPVLKQTPCGKCIMIQELCVKVPIEISVESNIGDTPSCCGCRPRENKPRRPKWRRESYWGRGLYEDIP